MLILSALCLSARKGRYMSKRLLTKDLSLLLIVLTTQLLFISCEQPAIPGDDDQLQTAEVRVHLDDLQIEQVDNSDTRSTDDPISVKDVKALTVVFFDSDNNKVYNSTQLLDDPTTYTTFGEFKCTLPIGDYTLVAVGRGYSKGDELDISSPVLAGYTSERVRPTFSNTMPLSVTSTDPMDVPFAIVNASTMLKIYSKDVRPDEVAKIRTTFQMASKSFNPTTGYATDSLGFSMTNSVGSKGEPLKIGNYAFLTADEQQMDIKIESLDASGNVLYTRLAKNVPLKRDGITKITGTIFTSSSISIKIETPWAQGETEYDIDKNQ